MHNQNKAPTFEVVRTLRVWKTRLDEVIIEMNIYRHSAHPKLGAFQFPLLRQSTR